MVLAESQRMVNEVLPELAKVLYLGMVVCYASVQSYGSARTQFGIRHTTVPSLTISAAGHFIAYPEDQPLELKQLSIFGTNILKGEGPTLGKSGGAIDEISNP